jgi:hypothetical protein
MLGDRVLACEEAIVTGTFAAEPLDEDLLLEFHRPFVAIWSRIGRAVGVRWRFR